MQTQVVEGSVILHVNAINRLKLWMTMQNRNACHVLKILQDVTRVNVIFYVDQSHSFKSVCHKGEQILMWDRWW